MNRDGIIYLKPLPKIRFGPVMGDYGFTLSERLALKRAWNLIRPFTRRYGQDVFFTYITKEFWGINKFRDGKDLNLQGLHRHALTFIRFIGVLIEEQDPIMFQLLINDNNVIHSRCKVGSYYIGELAKALVDYLLKALEKVSSPTLERGFAKILQIFQGYQDNQTRAGAYDRLSKN